MENDIQDAHSKPTFSTKQKVTVVVIVVIVIFVIWQVVGLFRGAPAITPVKSKMAATATVKTTTTMATTTPPSSASLTSAMNVSAPVPPSVAPQSEEPRMLSAAAEKISETLKTQQVVQEKYLNDLNQLQLLKIQREIAENSQAIATATLAKVTAEKNINEMLTQPAVQPAPPVPMSAYSTALTNPNVVIPVVKPPQEVQPAPADYVVLSVSQELGRWHAVMGYQSAMYNVSVGDVLPADHSIVASISQDGVVLKKEGQKRKVSLLPAI